MARKDFFGQVTEYREFTSRGLSWKLPILYRRLDAFSSIYTASYEAVKSIMPSERFQLARISPGRMLIMFSAFNYLDTDVGPYGEFGVSIPTYVKHEGKRYRGFFIYRLPVTTEVAMVAGIECYGFPKSVTEMKHENGQNNYSVSISQDGRRILDMSIEKGGFSIGFSGEMGMFTVKDGEIMYTEFIGQAVARIKLFGKGELSLGDHPMADEIRALDIGNKPFATGDILDTSAVLPEGIGLGKV